MLKFFNSLTRKVEEFVPLNPPKAGIYTCGPTVYDYQHIGNLRTFINSDILIRVLKADGYKPVSVRNITDIEDKIIKRAKERNISTDELTKEYTALFFEDLEKLNILPVSYNPKATEFVGKMIEYVEELVQKGLAYVEKDGSVYFDISKFKNYGKLARLDMRNLKTGTRVLSDEYTKDDIQDFALWKTVGAGEVGYDSPWGRGRPGWHIECSVMSQKLLGETFDIHTGGVDLQFPHHENEIAQSEGKTGKKFVNYFVHMEHLLVDNQKMSKSLNNFYRLKDLEDRGFDPLAFRYLVLTTHYRDKLNFTWEALRAAQKGLDKLRGQLLTLKEEKSRLALSPEKGAKIDELRKEFSAYINDDLGVPRALAILWEALKSNVPSEDKYDLAVSFDEVLGLGLAQVSSIKYQVSSEVKKLIEERERLRREDKFEDADEIRKKIEKMGYLIEDTDQRTRVKVKK